MRNLNERTQKTVRNGEPPYYLLAIHPISKTSVPGNAVTKVFEIESALEARCEETTEWCGQRCEGCHDQGVNQEGRPGDWWYLQLRETSERR